MYCDLDTSLRKRIRSDLCGPLNVLHEQRGDDANADDDDNADDETNAVANCYGNAMSMYQMLFDSPSRSCLTAIAVCPYDSDFIATGGYDCTLKVRASCVSAAAAAAAAAAAFASQ